MKKISFLTLVSLCCISQSLYALPSKLYEALGLFTKIIYIVEDEYVEEIDEDKLIKGAIKGMLESLDPHSVYLAPEFFKELKVDTSGKFGGVGIEISHKQGIITVVSPIEDTPAFQSGIKPGDRIVRIDGKSTKTMTLSDAVSAMRGVRGSKVNLTVFREGHKGFIDFHITREIIRIKSVKSELLEGGIAYIRLAAFQINSSRDFKKALSKLKSEAGGRLNGLIVDLRNNPGGLLSQAVEISDLFLEKGVIVSTKGRKQPEKVKEAQKEGTEEKYPVVLLINRGSASASEIVAGALSDHRRAKLMGERSFGKGSVQTVIDLGDNSGLKLTIAKYYTPKGTSIHGKGIDPDYWLRTSLDKKGKKTETESQGSESDQSKVDIQKIAALEYLRTGRVPREYLAPKKKLEK